MKIIPFKQKDLSIPSSVQPGPEGTVSPLTSIRLKEIVPRYQDVTIRCVVSAYLAATPAIRSAEDVFRLFGFLEFETRETFFALHLNCKNEILCLDQASIGSLTATIVHPREIYVSALISGAAAVVFVHNHPSGDPTPSREDHEIHRRLVDAGELLGIRVLDSVVVGSKGRYVSLVSAGTSAAGGEATLDEPPLLFV